MFVWYYISNERSGDMKTYQVKIDILITAENEEEAICYFRRRMENIEASVFEVEEQE